MSDSKKKTESQIDKFREAARKLETDDREEAFDANLKKIAKASPQRNDDHEDNSSPSKV